MPSTEDYVEQRRQERERSFQVGEGVVKQERDGFTEYASGATRSSDADGFAYDLFSPYALEAISKRYRLGANTHGARNWEKGMPEDVIINHAWAHMVKYMKGDRSEDHPAAIAWGMCALIHFRDCPKETTQS